MILCFAKASSNSLVTIRDRRPTAARRTWDRATGILRAPAVYGLSGFGMDERERAGDTGPVTPFRDTEDCGC